uniref:glycosyltransferase n=1 Tax=Sphingomonas sp. TaxID=28214 RepID=UPI0025F57463
FRRKPGEIVVGTLAGLRDVKDLPMLVRAVGGCSSRIRLVIVGEGPERERIADTAENMGIADTVLLPGFLREPHKFVGLFDIMAMSSKSEQFPISVIEGMAAGLPIVAPAVGDVPHMVAPENADFITRFKGEVPIRDAIEKLARDAMLRASIGAANRAKAAAEFDEATMVARYVNLYEAAMGRPGSLAECLV